MDDNFLIYDYETFGANPRLDRPAQFAAIRVDKTLENIKDKKVFFCKPADDYIPEPESVLITGITPQKALRDGVIESEFALRVHQMFSKPNTCVVGYNNIRFDDEYSRNILYRNFYDPYSWSYKNGNSRWDLLNVVRACYALRPDGIQWPLRDDGLPSFSLQDLAIANGIEHVNAHDAEMDVQATLSIARLVRSVQPKLFDYLYLYRDKHLLKKLINIDNMDPLIHVSSMFGAYRGNTALVTPIAWHPRFCNQVIVCDLSGDMQVLQDLDSADLRVRLYTSHDELKDSSPVPLKTVNITTCPVLINNLKVLDSKNADRLRIDYSRCLDNLTLLRAQNGLREKVISMYADDSFTPVEDVDDQLYDGFFGNKDREIMNVILATDPEKIMELDINFVDCRLDELLFRYRARNFPHTLNSKEKNSWIEHRKMRFTQSIIDEYIRKLNSLYLIHKGDENKKKLILELFDYLKQVIPEGINFPVVDLFDCNKK
ncbi:MAG: exodeoxyribonuclease I [Candidatus Liberibacter europaeus]|uniref:Exodeoxyribonuclease I n=1 Tax=Candidatus Liberibacter europaeus TaxID=744859 RepID=A0A2T4VYR1_9HYPH|nr:exodeoxyribonuclease I [Candidatus Liberibacter europaeus]PTL86908.1 MAG: exodeoxyribonuclease I [Candidatus Liberibacter europaeus]